MDPFSSLLREIDRRQIVMSAAVDRAAALPEGQVQNLAAAKANREMDELQVLLNCADKIKHNGGKLARWV